ncbi:hypothetical protein CPB83DRAFT_851499 [Crepidotus variabilis]|uniref:Uncharacterized protein n=1 Tax=Crepidotus variabilis TaxID=179855 RepID=A0A9P6EJJ1_9AGAR|nr:hypothetical protein CPB83DRAFT_851499 [Crepidotus variabilis]
MSILVFFKRARYPAQLMDIKEEVADQTFSLISPPITPSPPHYTVPCLPSTSRRRGSASSLAGVKRPRPYPLSNRGITTRPMSTSSYHPWSSSSSRRHPGQRKSSDEGQPAYTIPQQFMNEQYLNISEASDLRPLSSSSSSLTGAMGDAAISSHSRQSHSPVSIHSGHYTGNTQNHDLNSWNPQTHMSTQMSMAYPGVAGHGGMFNISGTVDMPLADYSSSRNSPDSGSPGSPEYHQNFDPYGRGPMAQQGNNGMTFVGPVPTYPSHQSTSPSGSREDDVQRLRRRVQDLERELMNSKTSMDAMRASIASSGLPTPPNSAAFQSSWRSRTESRKRIYCSLNRAGNALCAWHDSRRERRAYPPRNAPPGYLNCGCTYDEALFEESLSRHGVGSYLPGETVRMDPALRNPLLKLLQMRYGYKDGDFEHDPITETWAEGEAPALWEKKAQSGAVVKRRPDSERH